MAIAGFNPNPYQIGGPINFGSPASGYQSAYANALSINQQNYNNILAGYTGLTNSVLSNLQGQGAAEQQQITDQYAQSQGAANQSLISKGLGNTTVASSVNRGIQADKAKAQVQLAGQVSGQYAQYQSMLGQAQLGFMNSVSAPYPQASQYVNPYAGLKPPTSIPLQQPMGGGGGYIRSGQPNGGAGFNNNGSGQNYGSFGPYQSPQTAAGGKGQTLTDFGAMPGGEGYDMAGNFMGAPFAVPQQNASYHDPSMDTTNWTTPSEQNTLNQQYAYFNQPEQVYPSQPSTADWQTPSEAQTQANYGYFSPDQYYANEG